MLKNLHVIVGLGASAVSCARFLTQKNIPIAMIDTRANPPNLAQVKHDFPNVEIICGGLSDELLDKAAQIVISPGVAIAEPAIARQIARGTSVIGDIELFAQAVNAPVVAISGTNAKSTVTTLVGQMAEAAGLNVKVGGNLGVPALDLLTTPAPDLYILELSSFQLETTYSLKPIVATVLNVTPDHMDRYNTLEDYSLAKLRVYSQCKIAVCNRDDAMTNINDSSIKRKIQFTLHEPDENEFGLITTNGETFLAHGQQLLLSVKRLPVLGRHYQANALAALALGSSCGLPMEAMLQTLIEFKGLDHRCQLIRERNGVNWYNDSKGTNVGATLAAIDGLGCEIDGKLILIAGGVGKNADFSPLVPAIEKYVRTTILIGEAASILAEVLSDHVEVCFANSMDEAVALADKMALPSDSILLSPACASFDMFNNFEHRGKVFTEVVQGLT